MTDADVLRAWTLKSSLNLTRYFFKQNNDMKFIIGKHHQLICDALDDVLNGKCNKLMINISPRYGKCIAPYSLVSTVEGLKRADQITAGDMVFSYNNGKKVAARCKATEWAHKNCVKLLMRSGRTFTCSTDHPMLTPHGYIQAADLEDGDGVIAENEYMKNGNGDFYTDKVVSVMAVGDMDLIDLEIEGIHNFIANGLVSHNTEIAVKNFIAMGLAVNPSAKFIHLSFLGYINEPLKPARLEGNVFRLRLRGMDQDKAENWLSRQIYTLVYPNYYDKQRFGMPGHKKQTHLIGEALYNKDYQKAYEYLLESGTREASLPFNGDYEAFFNQIDKQIRGFYDSAVYSSYFNQRLGDLLEEGGPVCTVEDEGISFRMPKEKRTMAALMAEDFPEEKIGTFRVMTLEQKIPRKLLVTTNVNFLSCEEDEFHPGKAVLTVSFFLPMGAYATMAMKQLDLFL